MNRIVVFWRDLSIKFKFVILISIITFLSSALTSYFIYQKEVALIEKNLIESTRTDARLISKYCAIPLEFNMADGAKDLLSNLSAKPSIKDIIIYDNSDTVFLAQIKTKLPPPVLNEVFAKQTYYFDDNYLLIVEPIELLGKQYGHIVLRVYTGINELRFEQFQILILLLGLITVFATVLTLYFQRFLIHPILRLAEASDKMAGSKTYTKQIEPNSMDEIGILIRSYNSMLQTIQDRIAERDSAYSSLKQSEKIYRSLFEKSTEAIFIVDVQKYAIVDANKGAEELTARTREELLQVGPGEILRDGVQVLHTHAFPEEGESENFGEVVFLRKNREERITLFTIVRLNAQMLFGIALDITERKKAEIQLHKLSLAVEQSPLSVVITDAYGNVEYVNPYFTKLTGYSSNEVLGKNNSLLKSGYHDREYYKDLWNTISLGAIWSSEILNKSKSGELYWEAIIIIPIKDAHDVIVSYVALKENITGKKAMLEELIQSKNKAEEMNQLKSNFLANMSHELRTPMNGILGFSEIMQDLTEDPELIRVASTIHKSARRLLETLNLILDLSRIEADKLTIHFIPVVLDAILKSTLLLYEQAILNKGLSVTYENPHPETMILGDERVLHDIFNNLINNSIKFTPSGGLSVRVYYGNSEETKMVSIDIIDTGIGIPSDSIDVIFEEFRQVSEGRSRAFEGSGLGLTVTKRLVEKLSGNIKVRSEVGVGTVFTVRFPVHQSVVVHEVEQSADVSEQQSHITSAADLLTKRSVVEQGGNYSAAQRFRLLLVEDDEVNIDFMQTILEKDYQVDVAVSGEMSLLMAEKTQYDLVLMDINLGRGIDGVETAKRMRTLPDYQNIPIVAVTSYAMLGDKEEFLAKGLTAYLSKPFSRNELKAILKSLLESGT